jgi:hypothetical protein
LWLTIFLHSVVDRVVRDPKVFAEKAKELDGHGVTLGHIVFMTRD